MGKQKTITKVYNDVCFYIYKYRKARPISLGSYPTTEVTKRKKRLTFFAHYNSEGRVSASDWNYLGAILQLSDVVFISNSSICDEDKARLDKIKCKYIERENRGFDFGAWKEAISVYKNTILSYEQLSLINNSCYYPLFSLKVVYEKMEKKDIDFWGMTAFKENQRKGSIEAKILNMQEVPIHVQSYFIVFNLEQVKDCFFEFWDQYIGQDSFVETVIKGEVGLTKFLLEHGKRYDVYVEETLKEQEYIYSPDFSKHQPEKLIKWGSPLIKKKSLSQITEKQYRNLMEFLKKNNKDLYNEVNKTDYNSMISKTYRYLNKIFSILSI